MERYSSSAKGSISGDSDQIAVLVLKRDVSKLILFIFLVALGFYAG